MSRAFIQKRLPFKPTDIGGCSLWLDGADSSQIIFSSGSNVNTWNDKSGFSNSCSNQSLGTSITYPGTKVNGLNTVNFTAGCIRGALNSTSVVDTTDVTIVIVTVETAANNNLRIFSLTTAANYQDDQANQMLIYAAPGANQVTFYRAGVQPTAYTVTQNVPFIYTVTQTSGTGSQWLNGGSNITAGITTSAFAVTNYNIGTLYLANQNYTGLMGEVIMYKTLLSTTQRQQVESYIAQKWGMRQQLPQGHPGTRGIVYPSDPVNVLFRVPYQSAFIPTNIANCTLWLDAADATTFTYSSGTSIATWRDKATGIFGSNTSPTNQPTLVSSSQNGNSTVFFDAAAALKYIDIPPWSFGTTSRSLFIVMKNIASAVNSNVLGGYPHWLWDRVNGNNANVWTMVGILQIRPGDVIYFMPRNEYLIIGIIYSSPTMTAYQTGSQVLNYTSLSSFFDATNGYRLGALNNGDDSAPFPYRLYGNIAEVITYNTSVSTLQRQQVEGYLAWKWGLQANLPVGHPYKNASPSITNQFGISRPPNVLPIPPITISARAKIVPTLQTSTFTYTGANQTFQVPATISPASITIYMWGAGGGGNTNYGGAGAMLQGVLTATPGETLNILVGQGGTIDGTTTFGGGGAGGGNMTGGSAPGIGYSGNGFPQNAGSGGGRSAIQRGGTAPTNDIVVAGGGGGGTFFSSDRGGAATFSGTANPGTGGLPGLGGTQSAGGAGGGTGFYGQGLGGSRGIGGDTYNNNVYNGGGGGGGGYYGGGAGGTNGGDGAGGGGGSSLTDGLSLISGQSVLGFNSTNGFTAPNTGSPYYQSGVGNGAPAVNSSPRAGGNGLVVFIYTA